MHQYFNSYMFCMVRNKKKMQLDVDVSPPANTVTFRLGVTHVTFDPDPRDLRYGFLSSDLTSSLNFGQVTNRHTYIHTYRIRCIWAAHRAYAQVGHAQVGSKIIREVWCKLGQIQCDGLIDCCQITMIWRARPLRRIGVKATTLCVCAAWLFISFLLHHIY